MARSTSPPASSSQNIQCLRAMSTVAHMIRSARDPGWLAAGNAVSLLSVTQNPRHESHQAAGDAALGPGRPRGRPHSAASGGNRRPYEQVLPSVVTLCDQAVAQLVGAHPYHRRMSGSTTAAATWFTLRRRTTIYPPEPA